MRKKKSSYKYERRFIPELGKEMIFCPRRGTVRLYGNGPLCKVETVRWIEAGAKKLGKPVGEFLDSIAAANPITASKVNPVFHEDDDYVPREP